MHSEAFFPGHMILYIWPLLMTCGIVSGKNGTDSGYLEITFFLSTCHREKAVSRRGDLEP